MVIAKQIINVEIALFILNRLVIVVTKNEIGSLTFNICVIFNYHQKFPTCNRLPQLLKSLADETLSDDDGRVAGNITKGKTKLAKFLHAKGIMTQCTRSEEDNEKTTYYFYALKCGKRVLSVIGFHDQEGKALYSNHQKTVLESLRESTKRTGKSDAGDSK